MTRSRAGAGERERPEPAQAEELAQRNAELLAQQREQTETHVQLNAALRSMLEERDQALAEARAAEAALRASEERLRLALEAAVMGIWDWDPGSGRVVWSKEVEALYGLEPGSYDGTFETYMSLIHPEDRPVVAQLIGQVSERGGEFAVEHRAVWPDGTIRWLAGRGRAHLDTAGRLVRMAGTVMDVTDRHETKQELQRLVREKDAS